MAYSKRSNSSGTATRSLADRCKRNFDSQVRSRGDQYFREGRVKIGDVKKNALEATVRGSSGTYNVVLDWSHAGSGYLDASCTCPYYEDYGLCKHIWATILSASAQGIGPRTGKSDLDVFEFEDDDEYNDRYYDDDDWEEDDEDHDDWSPPYSYPSRSSNRRGSLPRSSPFQSRSRGKGKGSWRNQLSEVFQEHSDSGQQVLPLLDKTREAWYVLSVLASRASSSLIIELFQRETKQNGEFGKLKTLSVTRDELSRLTSPEDREMLRLLLASSEENGDSYGSYGYYSRYYGYRPKTSQVALAPGAYEHVLPRLSATGRFLLADENTPVAPDVSSPKVAWDGGPPWRFRLSVKPDDKAKRWILSGELVRGPEEAPVPLEVPVLLLSSGLVLFQDRLARLETQDSFSWIAALRKHSTIVVPYKDRGELLGRLWGLPSVPQANLPPNLRPQEIREPPQGRLIVRSPDKKSFGPERYYGDVEFHYEGKSVRAGDGSAGILDAENDRVLVRDPEKERELLRTLAERGAKAGDSSYYSREHDVEILPRRFSDLVDGLVQAGWIVEAEGHRFRKPGEWRLSVSSGVDWFELEGLLDFDGVTAKLPDLLEALHHGQNYVRLDDGSHGLLPQEWLARFGSLAELGEKEDGHIRFRPSQAMLLDALLAAQHEEQVSVDRRFAEMRQKLRSFEGISPAEAPRGFEGSLRDYQKEGLGWLHFLRDFRLGGCLADDMGLGKTVQVLALLQARRQRAKDADGRRAPSLVVVPRSLVFNWIEEARRFTPNLRVLDYTGLFRKDAFEQLDDYDLVITTYGTLSRDITKLKDFRFDYVILDEAQAIKNAGAQRAKACRLLQADHRLAMTGTPVENHLGELWSLFEFLNPGMLGSSMAFQNASKQIQEKTEDLGLLRRALAPFILRRTKAQVLKELPQKTEQTLYCELAGAQKKRYHELRDYYRASLTQRIEKTGLAKAKIQVLEALLRLRQAACHPGLLDKEQLDESSAKLDTLLEQITEVIDEGHKVLVFSQFTSFLSIVRRRLDAEKIPYEYLDGRTRDRQERVERFQNDPACPLFLISLKAGGHGLNLTAADYVFILDPWWNPAVEAQAVDRTHRIGQTRHVFAYRLIARDTVEEKIVELQKTKRDLADAIISADSSILRSLTAEDLQMLLT